MQYRSLLNESIHTNPDIFSKSHREQWEYLILNPVSQLDQGPNPTQSTPLVFVIDAVDELRGCEAARLRNIQLRFFVTGRPERSIHRAVRRITEHVEQGILQQVESAVVDADIRTYLEHEFETIAEEHRLPGWYTPQQVGAVVARSAGLFIYAATLAHALRELTDPSRSLTQFLARESPSLTGINNMYSLILEQSAPERFGDEMDYMARDHYRLIIGSFAVLSHALSMNSLQKLLATAGSSARLTLSPADIEGTVVGLGSVIDIPYIDGLPDTDRPVRIFHPSFRAFLLGKRQPALQHLLLDSEA
ncbi:hypothetical protein BJY00DRAFT_319065 [Aspergillus carlsbadensis]|nr:hypothetical protein BJY00DRAFT_319065 [Aspergillus carlsbadensis]